MSSEFHPLNGKHKASVYFFIRIQDSIYKIQEEITDGKYMWSRFEA